MHNCRQPVLLVDILEAFERNPRDTRAVRAVADALQDRGETSEALRFYALAAELAPTDVQLHHTWASVLVSASDSIHAENVLRKALTLNRDSALLAQDLAWVCVEGDRVDEAVELFRKAVIQLPSVPGLIGLCRCFLPGTNWRDACRRASRSIGWVDANRMRCYLGRSLLLAGQLSDAAECFQSILADNPSDPTTLLSLGDMAYAQGDIDTAIKCHLAVRTSHPGSRDATIACLFDYLAAERFNDARSLYRQNSNLVRACWGHGSRFVSVAPDWDGSSLKGKTILVHGCVGLGDTIQHCRFLYVLKALGASVILEVPKPLVRIMDTLPDVDSVVCRFDRLPHTDFESHIRDLFLLCAIRPETFALRVPYLFPGKLEQQRWRLLAPDSLLGAKVGVVWASGGLFSTGALWRRSVPLCDFEPLASVPGVAYVALQAGPARNELRPLSWTACFQDPMSEVVDILDTAAIIASLDLVVTVDTAVAHLAGAMGKQTFLMLPYAASWRWGLRKQECIWYPSIRLLRQARPGDWSGVVETVGRVLSGLTHDQAATSSS